MVKPLTFKGDKKLKKRKAPYPDTDARRDGSSKALIAQETAEGNGEDDSWVTAEVPTDIIGPILFLLPLSVPTCIACDANGKVFASEIQNIVEEELATAEPHDVRQVWIANRIAGTGEISFKGHHGRYLSCNNIGVLSATREAISPEESFLCISSPETLETFSIQTVREKFLTAGEDKVPEIRGDAESVSFTTTFRIRMQARFKPKLKANKEMRIKEKVSRKDLEETVGRRLDDREAKKLKKARMEGNYHEAILDVKAKSKHDKYA